MHSNGGRRQLLQDDDKVFSRHLTRDSSAANSSSRVFYYAGSSSSVPFLWESRPGTPKHPSSSSSSSSIIPPLTPPPSYQVKASRQSTPDCTCPRSKQKAVAAILSKLSLSTTRRPLPLHTSPASSISSSASSSSSSARSSSLHLSPLRLPGRRKTLSRTRFPRLEVDDDDNDDDGDGNRRHPEEEDGEEEEYFRTPSPTSTLRFGTRRSSKNRGSRFRGCYPVKSVRNTFYSIVGHQGSV